MLTKTPSPRGRTQQDRGCGGPEIRQKHLGEGHRVMGGARDVEWIREELENTRNLVDVAARIGVDQDKRVLALDHSGIFSDLGDIRYLLTKRLRKALVN